MEFRTQTSALRQQPLLAVLRGWDETLLFFFQVPWLTAHLATCSEPVYIEQAWCSHIVATVQHIAVRRAVIGALREEDLELGFASASTDRCYTPLSHHCLPDACRLSHKSHNTFLRRHYSLD